MGESAPLACTGTVPRGGPSVQPRSPLPAGAGDRDRIRRLCAVSGAALARQPTEVTIWVAARLGDRAAGRPGGRAADSLGQPGPGLSSISSQPWVGRAGLFSD